MKAKGFIQLITTWMFWVLCLWYTANNYPNTDMLPGVGLPLFVACMIITITIIYHADHEDNHY